MSMPEFEDATSLLGVDPWMRFDMWCARSWEMAQKATETVVSLGPHTNDTDERVLALFHAAQLAKEFAEMLNPLAVVNKSQPQKQSEPELVIMTPDMIAEILDDDE